MLLGLNQNSYENLSIIEFIKKAKRFQGIELDFKKLKNELSNNLTFKTLLDYFEMYNTKLINIFQLEDFSLCSEKDFKKIKIPILKKILYYSYKLECDLVTIAPSFESRDIPKWRIIRKTEKRIQEIMRIIKETDVKIGFEFINHPDSSIQTLSETKELLDLFISNANVGYVIDTYYLGKSKEDFGKIKDISDAIFLIQLSDFSQKLEETEAIDGESKRLFPGDGEFDFKEFINTIKSYRYKRFYSIEIDHSENEYDCYKKFKNMNISN